MIHTSRTVTVGKMESIINEPIVLYRGDREVEVEFVLNGSKFMFTNGGNVIKSTNATLGQLVVNTPTGENMFSEITECHEGKVVFVITKEMIDELVEVGFYSFQIRLFDDTQVSRVTIPPVHQGIDIRNPIAAEDETDLVDIGLVDYSVVRKDDYENVATFLPNGDYNKTLWEEHDVISRDRLNKVEDALYEINKSTENLYPTLQNQYDEFSAEVNKDVKAYKEEMEDEVEQFERDMTQAFGEFKVDYKDEVHERLDEVSEELEVVNSQLTRTMKVFNVKEFGGAIGDGETDDYEAIQNCINEATKVNGTVFIPSGKYYISRTLRTKHRTSYHYRPGISIEGEGYSSVIQGYKTSEGKNKEACDYNTNINDQALLSLHGGNNEINNLCFEGGKVGLYLGQDNRETTERSSVSFNIIENCWFYDNGTSIIFENGEGCNYNKLRNIHMAQCQIGLHLKLGLYVTDRNNNNRNTFENMRATRCWIGYLVENGDGNFFNNCYGEGITDGSTVIGDKPSQLPEECGDKHISFIINGSNNTIDGAFCENCDLDLYSIGYRNNFVNVGFLDYSGTECKVLFPVSNRQPNYYFGNAIMIPGIRYQLNTNALYEGESGLSLTMPIIDSDAKLGRTLRITSAYLNTDNIHSQSKISFRKFNGSLFINVTLRFNIEDTNKVLYLKVPYSDNFTLDEVYTANVGGNLLLPCVKTTSPHLQTQSQSYYSLSNYDENSENKAIYLVFAPNTSWATSNNVIFVSSVINTKF